jgi:HAD superfamily hydrolase (TIGR01549 family)
VPRTSAVFFDVDFTLLEPGPRFQASGYHETCRQHGIDVDVTRFDRAVLDAAEVLIAAHGDLSFNPQVYVDYTARIIELMGGDAARAQAAAAEIYAAWGRHEHFTLYEDVAEALRALKDAGHVLGIITNGHRPLETFDAHFALEGLISVAVSSRDHGFMKPHRTIFEEALTRAGVRADEAVMVGDSYAHDVEGAVAVGMRGVLLQRSDAHPAPPLDVPVIRSLSELPGVIEAFGDR